MDLHHKEIQGFFSFPVDNLRASSFLVQYIRENVSSWSSKDTKVLYYPKSAIIMLTKVLTAHPKIYI